MSKLTQLLTKNKIIFIFLTTCLIALAVWAYFFLKSESLPSDKVYIAVGDDGFVAVFDTKSQEVIKEIDLTETRGSESVMFMPHNVQISPDKETVWVTANQMPQTAHNTHDNGKTYSQSIYPDQVIVISTSDNRIKQRIPTEKNVMLAHVVLTPDSKFAYATAQKANLVYKINTKTFQVEEQIRTPFLSEPHGIRLAPDGKQGYLALSKGRSLGILDLAKDVVTYIPLDGEAVQTGITADGKWVGVTLYDSRKIAIYNTLTKKLKHLSIPSSFGPIQLYPTSDSGYFFIADQGYYNSRPSNNKVYKLNIATEKFEEGLEVGKAPHGVVVDSKDKFVYVTNIVGNSLSIVDARQSKQIVEIPVGRSPNGITLLED